MARFKDDRLIFTDTSTPALPGAICPCLLCTKPFLMGVFIGEPDQICPECTKTYADTAKIVCAGCRSKAVICRVAPGRLDNGFNVWPRTVLHSTRCNVCSPGLRESVIVEIAEWERTHREHKLILTPATSANINQRIIG